MSELRLNTDGHIIKLGADNDVTLTHVADTGILLNSTMQLQFNDSSQFINAPSATVLDINATDEIELNATLVDVNANLDVSGTITSGGVVTGTAFTAGSAVLAEAELELLDGLTAGTAIASKVVTTDANIDTTGQRNLTISGELDAATLDISGNADIDGTTNLDAVDIDGAVQLDSTLTIGVDDTGHDVKLFGATSGAFTLYDESADSLIVRQGASGATASTDANNLVVEGSGITGISLLTAAGEDTGIYFGDNNDNDIGFINYSHNGNIMMFKTNASEAMRITSDGNVQIGTTTNNGRLTTTTASNEVGTQINCTSASYDGNVINLVASRDTTNETYNILRGQNGAGFAVAIRDSGNVENVNNSYGASSDERIKQNITDASSQWDDIKALKIRNYKLKKDTSKTLIGVVAQELEASGMNGLVGGSTAEDKETVALSSDFGTLYEDGDSIPEGKAIGDIKTVDQKVKSVKYSVLYMKAIKALQEAQTRIETLESKVTALEG